MTETRTLRIISGVNFEIDVTSAVRIIACFNFQLKVQALTNTCDWGNILLVCRSDPEGIAAHEPPREVNFAVGETVRRRVGFGAVNAGGIIHNLSMRYRSNKQGF